MERNNPLIALLIVPVVAILLYSNTFFASFHFDDEFNIVENDRLRDLSNFWPPSGTRYIGFLSFALNYHIHGFNVFGYHLVNLIIHILNGLLVWKLVLLTFKTPAMRPFIADSGQKGFMALLCALIFVAHPVQTQAVTYIVQRFTSLATLFYLLSLVLYIQARLSFQVSGQGLARQNRALNVRGWLCYMTSLAFALLAMKTKEISFTLPWVIALYEITFFRSSDPKFRVSSLKSLYMLIPFVLILLVIPFSVIKTDKELGDIIGELREASQETEEIPRVSYLLTQFRVILTYIRLMLLPINQNLDYDYTIYHTLTPPVFLSLLFNLLIITLAFYLFYRSRHRDPQLGFIAFGILWFFITLSVEASVIPIRDVINEHRLYLPSIGMIMSFSLTVFAGLKFLKLERRESRPLQVFKDVPHQVSVLIVHYLFIFMIVLPLGIATYNRNLVWSDDVSLWEDVVRKSPNKARGHYNLGLAYHEQGQLEKAIQEYLSALRLKIDYLGPYNNLGLAYYQQGRLGEAIQEYLSALRLRPDYAEAHNNLGLTYYQQGRLEEAVQEYRSAIKLKPSFPGPYNNLGLVYYQQGRLEEAIQQYITAIRLRPDYPEAHNHLGLAYSRKGRLDEAIQEFQTAIKLKPEFPEAHNNLGLVYHQQGRLGEAIQEYRNAIRMKPEFSVAHYRLGLVYHQQRRLEEAIQEYLTAIKFKPEFPEAHNNLGLAYYQKGWPEQAIKEFSIALEQNPNYPEAHYNLGNVYRLMGLENEAKKQFNIVLELIPDFVPAKQALDSLRRESHRVKRKVN